MSLAKSSSKMDNPAVDKVRKSELLAQLRKERSAEAARNRRNKENKEYDHVKKLLPIDEAIAKNLDKASVIRITISFLRMCKFAENGATDWNSLNAMQVDAAEQSKFGHHQQQKLLGKHVLKALDGFLLVISTDGRILYVSESVNDHLGLNWEELPGAKIQEIVPNCEDLTELKSCLRKLSCKEDAGNDEHVNLVIRFKSQKEKRHGAANTKSKNVAPTKSCQLIGSLRYSPNDDARGLICCVVPLMSITPREITLPPSSFFVITDLNFVVNKCDTKLRHYIELEHEDMLDVSIYSMIHPNDIDNLQRAHQQLLNKGQSATLHFRWFQRNSGHKWVKSTLSKTQIKGNTEDCILWVNQVISEHRDSYQGLDLFQLFPADLKVVLNGQRTTTITNDDHAIADLHTPAPVHISSLFPTTTSNQHQGGLNGIMNTVYPASKSSKSEQLRLSAPPPPPPPQPPQPLSTAPVVEKDQDEEEYHELKATWSPGSSRGSEMGSDSEMDQSRPKRELADSTVSDPTKDLRNDPGNYPNPVSINVPSSNAAPSQRISLCGKEATQLRNSITNRATLSVVTGKHSRKGKSVVVMPISIKNEPTQIKHHFPKDSGSEPTAKRFRNEKDQKKILSRHQTTQKERVKETVKSLRSELDGPGVIVVKNWKPNDDDEHPALHKPRLHKSQDDIPRIRLPRRANNNTTAATTNQDNIPHISVVSNTPQVIDQVPSYQSIESEALQNQAIYLHPADQSPHLEQVRDPTPNPSPHYRYHLTQPSIQHSAIQTIRMEPAIQQQPPPPPPTPQQQLTTEQKIYWVPCSKIDTPDGPKYEQLRNVDVHVSQNGSHDLRPISQQQQAPPPPQQHQQQQHLVQQTQQREARATPFYIEKLSYAPMPSEHPVLYVPTSGSNIMTSQSLPQIMPVNGGQFAQNSGHPIQSVIPLILPTQNQQQQYLAVVPVGGQVQQIGGASGPSLQVKV